MSMLPSQLSLVTYNIHKGFGFGRKRFSLPQIRNALTHLNADFVFLQEVQGQHRKREKKIEEWPQTPQFAYIAKEIWPYYVYARNAVYQAGHHGNAILSKYPFSTFENINLTTVNRASRSILHSQIHFLGEKPIHLHLLCVHLGLFKAERKQQCQRLIARIKEEIEEDQPLIMAGDFNDWQHALSKPLEEALGVQEAFISIEGQHAKSFPAIRPALCIDRIYFRGLKVNEVRCLHAEPWHKLSDHLPLYAEFELL